MIETLTQDRLLGGRVLLAQPAQGYRVAIDPVLLAAAVPATAGDRVLDAGAGTGAAALCLAMRVPTCAVTGIELQPALQQIAATNVTANALATRVEIRLGDLTRLAPAESFDHVMTNPPYLAPGSATPPPARQRVGAHVESMALDVWLRACLRVLAPGGTLTLIHRAERLAEILAGLAGAVGALTLFPLWPGERGKPAKRVLVQGRKGSRAPLALRPGLVLHAADGRLSDAAEAVLRHGEALALSGGPTHA